MPIYLFRYINLFISTTFGIKNVGFVYFFNLRNWWITLNKTAVSPKTQPESSRLLHKYFIVYSKRTLEPLRGGELQEQILPLAQFYVGLVFSAIRCFRPDKLVTGLILRQIEIGWFGNLMRFNSIGKHLLFPARQPPWFQAGEFELKSGKFGLKPD